MVLIHFGIKKIHEDAIDVRLREPSLSLST